MSRLPRAIAVFSLILGGGALIAGPAQASGDWTHISTPAGSMYPFFNSAGTPTTTVSGSTSSSITATDTIDIYCSSVDDTFVDGPLNSSPFAVTSGVGNNTFSGTINVPTSDVPCTMRAVPSTYSGITGSKNNGYLGAYTGPEFLLGFFSRQTNGSGILYGSAALDFQPRAADAVESPGLCGLPFHYPLDPFSHVVGGGGAEQCDLTVPVGNLVAAGPSTRSSVQVDGHNAYTPYLLHGVVPDAGAPQEQFSATRSHTNGNTTAKFTEPLVRCAGDPYPVSSCTVVSTGVRLVRTVSISDAGRLLSVLDTYTTTNGHQHSIKIEYSGKNPPPASGLPGWRTSKDHAFIAEPSGTTVSGFAHAVATLFSVNDIYARDGSNTNADFGLSYSAAPSSIFFPDDADYGLRYNRTVPAAGSLRLGFVETEGFSFGDVAGRAAADRRLLAGHITISSPAAAAHVHSPVTVKGLVAGDANGLPSKVTVKSGTRSKTVSVGSGGKFSASLTLAVGQHTITVRGVDPAGNTLTKSVKIRVIN